MGVVSADGRKGLLCRTGGEVETESERERLVLLAEAGELKDLSSSAFTFSDVGYSSVFLRPEGVEGTGVMDVTVPLLAEGEGLLFFAM